VDEMGRACSTNGKKSNTYRIIVRKPEVKSLLIRLRCGRLNNIEMDLKSGKVGVMNWIYLSQDRNH
jgi:hypothetical protein